MADEAQVLAEAAKLPLEERATHANWKVRSAAYEAIKAGCNAVFDPSDPVLSEYAGVFGKATADGNAAALDKALEALAAFLDKASEAAAGRIAGTCSSHIVAKALGARPSTAAKGQDCLAAFVEAEQADKATAALVEGYGHKVPKVVVGSLDATLALVRAFGGRVMPGQAILKAMPPLFESKDAKARDRVKEIVAELARWMGPELIRAALFEKMRDAMKEDVEKLLQEAPAGRPKPERLTRKEAAKAAAAAAAAAAADSEPGAAASGGGGGRAAAAAAEQEPEQVDSYEFAEPRDIIPELKKDFWEGLAAAKWSERKAALTSLRELAAYPRLANGDYGDVNRELKKIITKDSNIQVVSEAINCTANIAKGLRKDYRGPAMSLCPVLLEKFKDKAAVVGRAAAEALDAMARHAFSLADVAEDVAAALAHQNPKVKECTLSWLTGCVSREARPGVLKLLPLVVPAAAKCTDEGAPAIREAAFGFLTAAALRAGSLASLDKGLAKMDEAKRKRLEELVLNAAKGGGASGGGGGGAAKPRAAAAPPSRGSSRPPSVPASGGPSPSGSPRASSTGGAPPARPGRTAPVRSSSSSNRPPPSGVRTRAAAAAATSAGSGDAGGSAGGAEDEAGLAGGLLNPTEAKEQLAELVGEATVAALADAQWKVRLEAMEAVVAKAQEPGAAEHASLLVQAVAAAPGWDEKNFQVMARQFEVIRTAAAAPGFGKREALVAVTGATDKLADLKLKEPAGQMLLAASEAVGPQFVAALLHKRAAAHKNPKVLTETLNWLSTAITDFLLPAFSVPALLAWAKEDLGSANAATRTAATQLLGTMHAFLGPPLAEMVRPDLKPALMATVEVEFSKQPQQSGWQAKRVARSAARPAAAGGRPPKARAGSGGGGAAAAADEPPSMDDLLPRADISGQLGDGVIAKLGSANWKERKEALDEVEAIVAATGSRIQPSVGDLMPALKARMADSNKNLIAQTLSLLAKLAKAMGRPIAREARPVLAPAVRCICDSKHNVRAAVIEFLEAWAAVAPLEAPFEEVLEVLPSPKCVSEGMQAALAWMAGAYASGARAGSAECVASAARAAGVGAAYKTAPVREAAAQLLQAMAAALGLGEVQAAVGSINDKALAKSAADALAKVAAASGGNPAAAGPASGTSAAAGSRPATPRSATGSAPSSRPGTANGVPAGASRPGSRPGSAGGVGSRSLAASGSGSLLSRAGVTAAPAAAAAAAPGAAADGPLLGLDRGKEERARKARFKSSKFEIRPDELQQLEAELGALAAPGLKANLFSKEFKKQVAAADALRAWITASPDEAYEACVACLDLLLRWCVVRLADGNTQTLVSVTGMLKALLDLLSGRGYRLSEAEVKAFMPGLVEKCGQPQPNVKADCRELMARVASMHAPGKVLSFIQEGLNSKNNRSRVACAEELGCLVDREGPRVYAGAKCDVLAALARLVAEPGKDIRAAALAALEQAYSFEGEGIWKQLGALNGQQRGILEERLKTVDRDLARRGLVPGYRRAALAAESSAASVGAAAAGPGGEPPAAASASPRNGGGGYAQAAGSGLSSTAGLVSLGTGGLGAQASTTSLCHSDASLVSGNAAAAAAFVQPVLLATQPLITQPLPPLQPLLQQPLQQQQAQQQAVAAPAATGPPHYQPLQSFGSRAEIYAEFEKCLGILQQGAPEDVIEVMKLLCYEMMDLQRTQAAAAAGNAAAASPNSEVVWQLLQRQADTLVVLLTMQTQQVFEVASACMAAGPLPPSNCRACKYALNTLMNIFSSAALPAGLRQDSLAGLVRVLLLRLVDDNLGRQPEGEALLKALNVLMLKILENSNRNFTFSALLSLLLDVPPELGAAAGAAAAAGGADPGGAATQLAAQQARWADLVVKCLIKSTKALPQVIQSIDLRGLLLVIHGFFEALGVDEIRRRSQADDKPLRMVKTILHELCKLKGTDIYRYTADIPQHGSTSGADGKPVIFPYIDLNIQTLQGSGAIRSSAAVGHGAAPGPPGSAAVTPGRPGLGARPGAMAAAAAASGAAPVPAAPGTPGAALRSQRDNIVAQLSAVFTRLSAHMQHASRDSSEKRAVLLDIYAISQAQGLPIEALMAAYLPDTTPAFKAWIAGEMRKIHLEQQADDDAAAAAAAAATPGGKLAVGEPAAGHGHDARNQHDTSGGAWPAGVAAGELPIDGGAVAVVAAVGSPGGLKAQPAALGALGAAAAGGGAPTMEALKARMSQLQSEKARVLTIAGGAATPGSGALGGADAGPAGGPPGALGAGLAAAAPVPAAVEAAPQQQPFTRNLQDLRSRMRGLTGL